MDLLLQGKYTLIGDAYYELKNDGYYSPDLFEGYVQRPIVELTATVGIDFNYTVLGVYHVRSSLRFNLLKLGIGF